MRAIQSTRVIHKAIQIQVRVCNVVKSSANSTGLSNACPDCKGNLSKPNMCRGCNKEVLHGDVLKKYAITKEEQRILTTKELEQLKGIGSTMNVLGTIDKDQFKQSFIVGSYYVLPQTKLKLKSEQQQVEQNKIDYAILKESVLRSDNMLAVKFAIRDKEKLGVFTVENDYIVLLSLAYPEFVQEQDEETAIKLDEAQKKMSEKFVESIKPIDLSSVTDSYTETLEKILEGKSDPQAQKKVETSNMWSSL